MKPRTVKQAADELNVSVPMIRKMIRLKQLKAIRIGRAIRIPAAAIASIAEHGTR